MTTDAALIVSRFVHYLALSILFGGAAFPFYGFASPKADPFLELPWLRPVLIGSGLFTLASGLAWFFTVAGAGGNFFAAIRNTDFGWAWLIRLPLAAGLVLLLLGKRISARRFQAVLVGSLVLLAGLALTGHSGSDSSAAALQHRILDAVHLIASGVWVGALVVLAGLVTISVRNLKAGDLEILHHALSRFSGIGTVVVATLTLTGILNPGFSSSFQTLYGQVLLAKLAIFGGMLLLAAANRFWLTPRLSGTLQSPDGLATAMRALRVSILIETAFGVLVLLLVGWLGVLAPPVLP